jgi:hypothetical protein
VCSLEARVIEDLELPPYRILVTGWRFWPRDAAYVIHDALAEAVLVDPHVGKRLVVVVDGWCPRGGVDKWANQWAREHEPLVQWERHRAKVGPGGRFMGPERNSLMVNLGADVCLAFPAGSSTGTVDCMKKARAAGIPVLETVWNRDFRRLDVTPSSP